MSEKARSEMSRAPAEDWSKSNRMERTSESWIPVNLVNGMLTVFKKTFGTGLPWTGGKRPGGKKSAPETPPTPPIRTDAEAPAPSTSLTVKSCGTPAGLVWKLTPARN
jgi:hypothetical protein